ncbi:uncharacterized protein LOC129914177 [Episyrphus balteatus]|uniref:uncharacterized protein LOC129914177 n=1 Tax=Episyrphus balteatus TaxID=286459 RepID=UPI0024866B99|nr:uncharacterized protein LOC129914177 [Episyrphus balteatus]
MKMEAVEIKTEPLDEYFNQIPQEEVIIKSENEMDYNCPLDIHCREPEVQINEGLLDIKVEITKEPEEPTTPKRSPKEDWLREETNSDIDCNHCKFCNMFFKSRTTLKLHERNCPQKNDCRLCGQKFITSYALNTHLNKVHNRDADYVSPQKDIKRCKLGRPPNIDSGNQNYICDICNLKFANSRDLNNHIKKHNTCQQCGEHFKSYDDVKQHICENAPVKEEVQSDTETPTKKIFKATKSMVVIPGEQAHTPVKLSAKAKNARPKKRKSRVLSQKNSIEASSDTENGNISSYNSSPKSGFSVVTKDTDFEAFAQQMMKGLTDIPESSPKFKKSEPISDRILRKLQISTEGDNKSNDCVQSELTTKAESNTNTADNVIVDSEGNVYTILKENFVSETPFIKEEPIDDFSGPDEEPAEPKMPSPLPYIKDEPPDEPVTAADSTDLLLEELFDRKVKSIAKVRQTKFPLNPSFETNGLGFKVKKEITAQKPSDFESKTQKLNFDSPKGKKRSFKNKCARNVIIKKKSLVHLSPHVSRRKALPHKIKEEILENIIPASENSNQNKGRNRVSKQQSRKKLFPPKVSPKKDSPKRILPTLKDKNSGEIFASKKELLQHRRKQTLSALKVAQKEIKKELLPINGDGAEFLKFLNANAILADVNSSACKINAAGDGTCLSTDIKCSTVVTASNQENINIGGDVSLKHDDDNETADAELKILIKEEIVDNISSKPDDSNQPPITMPDIPLDGDFDFEEIIQSNKLPNFNNVNQVIQTLTEEYKKAENVILKEPAPPPVNEASEVVESQPSIQSAEILDERNRPGSLFFPMLDDTQIYSMVANSLNEKYRYVWICPLCPRQYYQVRPFKKHLLTIHYRTTEELEGKTFELRPELVFESAPDETFCHLCHVTLADNASLIKHKIELHQEEDLTQTQKKKSMLHKCYICSKVCSTRGLLAEHMKSDCGKNPQHACNVCDKKFHTKSTLTLHKTMHTGELPHSCGYCQKRFRTRGQLTVHTRTHTGEKPFPCKVCGQRFTHRETLIAHLSRHIDMKRYKCYGCDQFFSCISGLKTHRATRPETCGRVELNARAVGPRVRVIKGNVIFEPQPIYNARLAKTPRPFQESYILDHNYHLKDPSQTKKVSKQTVKSEAIVVAP